MPALIPPTVCLWDFDSVRAENYQLQPLVRRIRDSVSAEVGRNAEKSFLISCDVRNLPSSTTKALNKIRNLDIVHVDNSQNSTAEEKIKQKLHQFDIDYREEPGILVLISGNEEFSYFLSNMGRSGWRVLLFHPKAVTKELLDCVDFHQDIGELLDDIESDTSVDKPMPRDQQEKAYLLMANLPTHLPTDKIVADLHMATEEFLGRVCYFNQLTGEAVLTYNAVENEAKGATALFLAKNCKTVFGYDLGVLAIKDPCGELARMKFTVQQVGDTHTTRRSRASSYGSGDAHTDPSSGVSSLSHPTSPHNDTTPNNSPKLHAHVKRGREQEPLKEEKRDEEEGFSPQHQGRRTVDTAAATEVEDHQHEDAEEEEEDDGTEIVVRDYASAVKKKPTQKARAAPGLKSPETDSNNNLPPTDDGQYRTYFQKPAMQCFHWDNPTHLNQGIRDCKFWHPRERCRFYPQCMMGADSCGYAHPFCGVYCECPPEHRDPQKNHRLKPPAYIRNAMIERERDRERERNSRESSSRSRTKSK